MNILDYAKGVERMVDPMRVGKILSLQPRMRYIPKWLGKKMVLSAAKKSDKMPFVVEPYCSFLFYELKEPSKIQKYLPDDFVPAKASVFEGGPEKYYGVVSMFRIHTSVFWGSRAELYLMAENSKTGLLSWIMMDYMSDTISYDEKSGLKSPDVSKAVMTTTCEGDFVCDMETLDKRKFVKCEMSLLNAKMQKLDPRFWIEGNTSIAYGRLAGEADGDLFSLTFFPEEMKQALFVPLSDVRNVKVSDNADIGGVLDMAASFPFAQHMLSDSPGQRTHYGSEEKLRAAVEKVDFRKIKGL